MKLEPRVALEVEGVDMTPHQLEVISAIYHHGSQRSAAQSMGITTQVLNRYVRQIEAKIHLKVAESTPTGTVLTADGEKIAKEYEALRVRMTKSKAPVVGCTIITENLLLSSLSKVDPEGKFDLVISDDQRNLKDFRAGMMDLVVLDDPLYAFDENDVIIDEIGSDRLLHVDRGPNYLRFLYGAQRIGFKHLEVTGKTIRVERTERSLTSLTNSNMSFFVNESLAARKGLKIKSDTDPRLLRHEILAIYREEGPDIASLLLELKKQRVS
jgi:molybdate transport repressor ModE-like protein